MTGNELVVQWLPFARRIARKEGESRMFIGDVRDLEQAAAEGLCRARDSFDPTLGAFSTHAGYLVRAAVQSELARHYIRARSRREVVPLLEEMPSRRDLPSRIEARERLMMVDGALRRMRPHWASLIVDVRVFGETAKAAGRRQGVSRQAASKQLGNAHRSLVEAVGA